MAGVIAVADPCLEKPKDKAAVLVSCLNASFTLAMRGLPSEVAAAKLEKLLARFHDLPDPSLSDPAIELSCLLPALAEIDGSVIDADIDLARYGQLQAGRCDDDIGNSPSVFAIYPN